MVLVLGPRCPSHAAAGTLSSLNFRQEIRGTADLADEMCKETDDRCKQDERLVSNPKTENLIYFVFFSGCHITSESVKKKEGEKKDKRRTWLTSKR